MKPGSQNATLMRRQSGFSLLVALIMLVVMTLLAVTAFRIGTNQAIIVSNAQYHNEGVDAAQQTIDIALNSSAFTQNPAAAIPTSNCVNGNANTWCIDSNGDGSSDFTVTLTPQPSCITAVTIPESSLDFSKASDLACVTGVQQTFGTVGAPNTTSLCANTYWEISAQAVGAATGTNVNAVQGISTRIATTDMTIFCP